MPEYTAYRSLRGEKPIALIAENGENLFHLFWNLRKSGNIPRFLEVFDKSDTHICSYAYLFSWFENTFQEFAKAVFDNYYIVYIKKTLHINNAQFQFRPPLKTLHSEFLKNKSSGKEFRITPQYVVDILSQADSHWIVWRLIPSKTQEMEQLYISNQLKPSQSTTQ
jgi:hypothetical protein